MNRSKGKQRLRELEARCKAVVVDVETTGLNPWRDEVVEFAMVRFSFTLAGQIFEHSIQEYAGLREPSRPIPAAATRIHGLTMDDVAGHLLDRGRITSMTREIDFFIAHNVSFDRPFVERLFPDLTRGKPWLCTMRGINWSKRGLASARLGDIAMHFRIPHENAHRALGDARTTFALLTLPGLQGGWAFTEMLERHYSSVRSRSSTF